MNYLSSCVLSKYLEFFKPLVGLSSNKYPAEICHVCMAKEITNCRQLFCIVEARGRAGGGGGGLKP